MPIEPYIPPTGFEPAGNVEIAPPAEESYEFDASPVQNSTKAVRSGGIYTALAGKEPAITSPSPNPELYVWDGEKNWRNLLTWVSQLLEQYQDENGTSVAWDDISGKPAGLITSESDPTVPAFVKSITQAQKDALVWLAAKFPMVNLTPGNLLVVAQNGDSVTQAQLGDLLAEYIPGITSVISGLVSPPNSLIVGQVGTDIRISWADVPRRAGYYQIENRYRISNGDWSDYQLINQVEYSEFSHVWETAYIPPYVTHVGARVRYLRPDNSASAWIESQTTYDANSPVVAETTYEIIPGSVRWWSDGGQVLQTQYEIIPGSVRWWQAEVTPPTGPTSPNAPNPITVRRYDANTIDVIVSDNNAGVDNYEYNYRELNTNTWYTLKNDGTLSTNATNPLLITFANNISTRLLSLSNAFFVGKTIQARARTWVDGVASPWSAIVTEIASTARVDYTPDTVPRTAKINIVKASGVYSDTEPDTDGGFTAYYYVNGRPYKDGSGNRKKFENETLAPGLLIEVSKIFVNPTYFPSWNELENTMYIAAIVGGNPAYINSYAQQNLITE